MKEKTFGMYPLQMAYSPLGSLKEKPFSPKISLSWRQAFALHVLILTCQYKPLIALLLSRFFLATRYYWWVIFISTEKSVQRYFQNHPVKSNTTNSNWYMVSIMKQHEVGRISRNWIKLWMLFVTYDAACLLIIAYEWWRYWQKIAFNEIFIISFKSSIWNTNWDMVSGPKQHEPR